MRGWLLLTAGLGLTTALVAGAAASAYPEPAATAQAPALNSGEWRTIAISSIASGSRTGERAASGKAVEPLRFKPTRPAAKLQLIRQAAIVDTTPLRVRGAVGPDLNASLRAAGVPAAAADDYIRALATRLDLSHGIGTADRFDLVIAQRRAGSEAELGRLLYAGLDRVGAGDVMLMRWAVDGRSDWVDAGGSGSRVAGMMWPVPARVSSSFGMRMHPLLRFMRFHRGIDLKAGWGTPILAAADGRVVSAGWSGGYGRQVRIGHADGLATSYSHMSRIAAAPGQFVRQGQLIGHVGSSGLSTGPHLHYEVFKDGRPVNPASIRFASVSRVDARDRQAMRARLRQLLSLKSKLG